jgi:CheY-like chemotaxis protein
MPVMDGFEFIQRLRADPARARLRVLALTALDRHQHYQQTLAAGFDGHLSKPVEWNRLVWLLQGERRGRARPLRARASRNAGRVEPEASR